MTSSVDVLNIETLTTYLEEHISGFQGPISAEKFSGGQSNPTFKITSTNGTYVLRRQPPGKLLKSAHAVDREYRVIHALQGSAVPVPKVLHLCEDRDVIGSLFYIMEYCEGNIFWDASLPQIENSAQRGQMYDEMNRVLAALHDVDVTAVGLDDYGKPGNYFSRQLSRWSQQYRDSELQPIPAMDTLIEWLQEHLPEDDGKVSLTHGDFRLDNLMFDPDNKKIIAVLDWELSTLGHPYADLAYQCMQLRLPDFGVPEGVAGLGGKNREALGIPSEKAYVAAYCQRRGIPDIENWSFYLAFSFFRLAAICQGVAKRAADGNASSKTAAKVGRLVGPLAEQALLIIHESSNGGNA